jgi:hypothetical protein
VGDLAFGRIIYAYGSESYYWLGARPATGSLIGWELETCPEGMDKYIFVHTQIQIIIIHSLPSPISSIYPMIINFLLHIAYVYLSN